MRAIHIVAGLICWVGMSGHVLEAREIDARSIMQSVNARDEGDNMIARMEMQLIDKNQHIRDRRIRVYQKNRRDDRLRMMLFEHPPDVRDTGFLTYDYLDDGREDDQWLYLPALHKSKRIATTDQSGSFMGSDFNYSDMSLRNLAAYEFRLLEELNVRGAPVWVIEAVPRSPQEAERSGYSKSLLFVRQDNFVVVRAIHFVHGSDKVKYMDVTELKEFDGVWVIMQVEMTTKRGQRTLHRTMLRLADVRFDTNLQEDDFTIRRLAKGL